MHLIDKLINDAKDIISVDRGKYVEPVFREIEKFLSEQGIPVKESYEPNNFWKYEAYPIEGFSRVAEIIKNELVPNVNGISLYNHVFKYIYMINLERYSLAVFTNIFGSGQDSKYSFVTYKKPARLDKNLTMSYIHPKYVLEELLRKMYMPSNHGNLATLADKKRDLISDWISINPEINFETVVEKPEESFKKDQIRLMQKIKKILVIADYDPKIPIYIGSSADIMECEKIAREMFPALEVSRNASKSFFDPRTVNHIFKNGRHILIKVWELLDHEIIPIIPHRKQKVAHISVLLKLALTDHITYEILDFAEIAAEKLLIFSYLLQREKDMREKGIYVSLVNCNYIGRNFPIDKYISNLRAANSAKYSNNNKK